MATFSDTTSASPWLASNLSETYFQITFNPLGNEIERSSELLIHSLQLGSVAPIKWDANLPLWRAAKLIEGCALSCHQAAMLSGPSLSLARIMNGRL